MREFRIRYLFWPHSPSATACRLFSDCQSTLRPHCSRMNYPRSINHFAPAKPPSRSSERLAHSHTRTHALGFSLHRQAAPPRGQTYAVCHLLPVCIFSSISPSCAVPIACNLTMDVCIGVSHREGGIKMRLGVHDRPVGLGIFGVCVFLFCIL